MPEPVGAETSACAPAEMAGQAWTCAGVGSANARANHSRTCGVNGARAGCTAGVVMCTVDARGPGKHHTAETERHGRRPTTAWASATRAAGRRVALLTYNDRVRTSRRRSPERRTGRARAIIVLALVIACVPAASARAAEPDAQTPSALTAAAAPAAVAFGGSAVLSGRLEGGGSCRSPGATLTVDATTDGLVWIAVAELATDSDGAFSLPVTPGPAWASTTYRVTFAGDAGLLPVHVTVLVGVEAGLGVPSVPQVGRPRQPFHGLGRPASTTSLRNAGRDAPLLRPRGGRVGRQSRLRRGRGDRR